MTKKVLVTGGHVTPALAVMAELKRRGWDIAYVGRTKALEGEETPAQEIVEVRRLGYRFIPITTGRVQRKFTSHTISSLFKIPLGFIQGFLIVLPNKPQVVLSFGGYVAVPVVFWSWVFGIPVVTHEQTLSPGLANKIIAFFATKICVAFPEVVDFFPKDKTIRTGNPLRREIFNEYQRIDLPKSKPVVYITGGNLGAHGINVKVEEVLEKLLARWTIIHQCGTSKKYRDFERLNKKREQLPTSLRKHYLLFSFLDSEHIGGIFKHADVIVTRAGANIASELIALTKAALFIPLPWAGESEQEKNAAYLTDLGCARQILQKDLTGELLLKEIDELFKKKAMVIQNLKSLRKNMILDADKRVADVLESVS